MVTVTEAAAKQIKKVAEESNAADKALRVAVVGGGCSGYQYQLGFDSEYDGDQKFDSNGVSILVDGRSAPMLDGVIVDYEETLQGSSFTFKNPNAEGGCGCGKSFSC